MTDFIIALLSGFGAGMLSAWGVGGGTLLLLVMTLFLHVEQQTAQAINLLFFLSAAGAGLLLHRKNGLIDKAVVRHTLPFGLAAAALGAWISTAVSPEVLRKPFGVLLLCTGLSVLWQSFQQKK